MLLVRLFHATIVVAIKIFAFANAASGKELTTSRVLAINTVSTVTTVIYLHPDITIVAIEVKFTFLFATITFATAIHLLIVVVTFSMNSVMTVTLRFCKLAGN